MLYFQRVGEICIYRVLKKKMSTNSLISSKAIVRSEGEMKTFADKQKPREFITTGCFPVENAQKSSRGNGRTLANNSKP